MQDTPARGSFEDYLRGVASRGEAVNIMFEKAIYDLTELLHKITAACESHHIPHELIGGFAVAIYVEEVRPELTHSTRDVDLLIHRSDLERVRTASAKDGFRFRHAAGVDMLIYGPTESARNAVHLLFTGEKVVSSQITPNPELHPAQKSFEGKNVSIIPVADLVRMKLSAYRRKDQVHIEILNEAGLITPQVEKTLTPELLERLQYIRDEPYPKPPAKG